MKRMITSLLAIGVLAAGAVLAPTAKHRFTALPVVHAERGCSNATLSGNYGFTFSGFQLQDFNGKSGRKSTPFYGAGLATFDGTGNMATVFSGSENGSLPGNQYVLILDSPGNFTYTVNSDCTVSLTAAPGSGGDNFVGVIVHDGSEVLVTDITAPDTLNLDLKKLERSHDRDE
jgi:hypothetical protein